MPPTIANAGITFYKGNRYMDINSYLRCGRIGETPRERLERYITDIDGVMYSVKDFPLLYRGTGYEEFNIRGSEDDCFTKLKRLEGKTKIWRSYTSTSTDEKCAFKFQKGILMVITPSPETKLVDLTKYDNLKYSRNEKEVLLARNTRYTINKVYEVVKKQGDYNRVYAQMEISLVP